MFKLFLSFLFILAAFSANAAEINLSGDEKTVTIKGTISPTDAVRFVDIVKPSTTTVVITSNGGASIGGMGIGYYIHENKLTTVAKGGCYSMCAYIWLAGNKRLIEKNSDVGIHSIYDSTTGERTDGSIMESGYYLGRIGIPESFADIVIAIPSSIILPLTPDFLNKYGIDARTL